MKYFYFVILVFLTCCVAEASRQFGRIADSINGHRQEVSLLKKEMARTNFDLECIDFNAQKLDRTLLQVSDDVWLLRMTLDEDLTQLNNTISNMKFGPLQ